MNLIPHRFKVDLPDTLVKEVVNCKSNAEVRQVGEWCIAQSKNYNKRSTYFTLLFNGKINQYSKIAEGVFKINRHFIHLKEY